MFKFNKIMSLWSTENYEEEFILAACDSHLTFSRHV